MVITILKARVEPDRTKDLERIFQREGSQLPPEIVESFLARDAGDESMYRIVTMWVSHEALEHYRASVDKAKGVLMFESVGAEPELSILEVVVHLASHANTP